MRRMKCLSTKQPKVRPSKEYINRITKYIPHKMEQIQHFKTQLFPTHQPMQTGEEDLPMFSADTYTIQSEGSIQQMMIELEEVKLIPLLKESANHGLVNSFRNVVANDAQRYNLLNFHQIAL